MTLHDFINSFGLVYYYSSVGDENDNDKVIGFSTPWFRVTRNHLDEIVLSHWAWRRDYILWTLNR